MGGSVMSHLHDVKMLHLGYFNVYSHTYTGESEGAYACQVTYTHAMKCN